MNIFRSTVMILMLSGCSGSIFGGNGSVNGGYSHSDGGYSATAGGSWVPSPTPSNSPTAPHVLGKPTVSPRYAAGANWNDYVTTSDTSVACLGSESSYKDCLHSGELRIASTDESSCTGLSLTDHLDVFTWTCKVISYKAVFYNSLKKDKGLSNLITVSGWKSNYVTLTDSSSSVSSDSGTWWSNNIIVLPNNSATSQTVALLNISGSIYVTDTNITTSGYNIAADKVSLVSVGNAQISYNGKAGTNTSINGTYVVGGGYITTIASGSHKFLWIETNVTQGTGGGGTMTMLLSADKFVRLHNTTSNGSNNALYLYQTSASTLEGTTLTFSGDSSVYLDSSSNNLVTDTLSHDNYYHYAIQMGNAGGNDVYGLQSYNNFGGVRVGNSTGENHFSNLRISNGQSGIYVINNYAVRNVFTQVTIANTNGNGISVSYSNGTIVHNAVAVNGNTGAVLSNALNATFSQMALASNTMGITAYHGEGLKLTGNVLTGGNTTECLVQYGYTGYSTTCANANASDSNWIKSINVASSFVGKLSSANYGTNLTTSGLFQGWGADGSVFISADNKGNCTSGVCRLWDWSLLTTDSVLLNRTDTGGVNSDCPTSVLGTKTLTSVDGDVYLKNAVQLGGNGLCQSNTTCLYTPNYGAYQGHGDLGVCTFNSNGGSVTGVTMYYYLENGR